MSYHSSLVARGSTPEHVTPQTVSLVVVIQVPSDFLKRLDNTHRPPAPVQAMDKFYNYQQPPTSHRTFPPINHQHPMATYLDYAPTHTGNAHSYDSCFARLGFKITASTTLKRDMLVNNLRAHVDHSVYRFLRSTDNEAALKSWSLSFSSSMARSTGVSLIASTSLNQMFLRDSSTHETPIAKIQGSFIFSKLINRC